MVRPAAISRMHVPGMSGGFLDLHNWRRRVWKKALGASSSYDGRHTAASLLIHEDRSLPYVTAFLGHSPAKTTLDHYAHVYAEAQLGAAVKMADAILDARQVCANRTQHRPGSSDRRHPRKPEARCWSGLLSHGRYWARNTLPADPLEALAAYLSHVLQGVL